MVIEFEIPGQPVPKTRARAKKGQRAYTPAHVVAAENAIKWELLAKRVKPFPKNVDLILTCWFFSVDRRRVDIDNLEKLVMDACNAGDNLGGGGAWYDDSQVIEKHAYLERGSPTPCTRVRIESK